MSSKFLNISGLKECIGRLAPFEAKDIIENISKFFDDQLSQPEIELAIQTVFNKDFGTIAFLNISIREQKKFSDCNINIFNLWISILIEHGTQKNFEPYIRDIIQCSTRYIISTLVSAKEKEKATIVLQEVFRNKLAEEIDASELVTKLIEVFNVKSRPATFSQQLFILLGIISQISPENISEKNAGLLRNIYLKTLEETLLNEETVQYKVLAGAMEGLNLFLMNFSPTPTENFEICDAIYVCVKKLSNPPSYVEAKAPFRCAIDLFIKHYPLFNSQILRDFKFWQECLTGFMWLSSPIYQDRRKGILAIQSFHKAIEHEFNKREVTEGDKKILLLLLKNFRLTLESSESKPYQNRIAIRGFGLMAKIFKEIFPEILNDVISLVIQRTELIYLAEDNELRESLEHFPDYVEALSQIMKEVGQKDEIVAHLLANTIQSILIRLIRDFHYLPKAHTNLASNSICRALFNLFELDGSLFDNVLNKIILQGIIWTCSHKLVYDASYDWETGIDWKDNITYKNYLDLWNALLEEVSHSDYDKIFISNQIFNSLIENLLHILDKLNLKTKRRVIEDKNGEDQEFYFCDPNIDLCPENPKDFHIFFNLVDFYRDILFSKYNKQYFYKWIHEYCNKMIHFIIQNPLVSGFLKLLMCGLTLARRLQFFSTNNENENETLLESLSFLLKTIIARTQKVTGELQLACLELILKFPHILYKEYIFDFIPIFKIAFDLGKNLLWLAKVAIKCLENITSHLYNSEHLAAFYKEVLPKLDCFLQSKGFEEQYISADIITYRNKKRVKRKSFIQRFESSELFDVQKRICKFLGHLQPHEAILVLDHKRSNDDLVKWQVDQSIKLNFHCKDSRLEIYLDTIIPRICHLATSSIDRKTKIAACEVVHSLVLYLLGAKIHEGMIWEELCSKILILGTDDDVTIHQMFEPLLRQIMHYMSKYENLNKGVDVLMKVLMDGISNANNCAVQDLSAICIREFVEWSIKQTTPQQLAASPVSIEIILNQLKLYSFDSNLSRRIGSALAFNNLYRNLREEESICDIFFIDLLYTFCVNYKLTEELSSVTPGSLNSELEQVSLSLDHTIRVLKQRNYLYRNPNSLRKMPDAIGSSDQVVLKDVIYFLWRECQNKLMNYRNKCLTMVFSLSTSVENSTSLSMFFNNNISTELIVDICEGSCKELHFQENNPYSSISIWMQHFLGSLDCYNWLLHNNAIKETKLLFSNSKIFDSISYYLTKICWKSIFELVSSLNSEYLNTELTESNLNQEEKESSRINAFKCIINGQIMNFLIEIIICNIRTEDIYFKFWSNQIENIVKLINNTLYEPSLLGFDLKFHGITKNYKELLVRFIKICQSQNLKQEFLYQIFDNIGTNLSKYVKKIADKTETFLSSDHIGEYTWNLSKGILYALKNIDFKEYLEMDCLIENGKKIMKFLFNGITKMIFDKNIALTLNPNVKKFGFQLLKISFGIGELSSAKYREIFLTDFVNYLLKDQMLIVRGTLKMIKHGEHFFETYKRAILESFTESNIDVIVPILFCKLSKNNSVFIVKFLTEMVEFCQKRKQYDQRTLQVLVDVNLKYFPKLIQVLSNPEDLSLIVNFMNNLCLACPLSWKIFQYKIKQPKLESYIIKNLQDSRFSLEQKIKIFVLLPIIISDHDFEHKELSMSLQKLQSQHFPLKSSEFRKNSIEETCLKVAFKSLLDALIISKSFILLDFILQATAADKKHIVEYMIRENLDIYIQSLNSENQGIVLERIFEKCKNQQLEPHIRVTILNRFLLPLLQNSNVETIIYFYTKFFAIILSLSDSKFGNLTEGWVVEQSLVNKIIGFSLIEIFFGILPKEKYYYPMCPIITAMLPNETLPNVFIGTLSRKCFYARTDILLTSDKEAEEFFRRYQCSAFKALCAIICNTQTDMKFYLKFLFEEIPQKNEYIWKKVIDCSDNKNYIHEHQEMESFARIKERFVSIRRLTNKLPISGRRQISTAKYLQTQNVFSSSLRPDINRVDMNYSMVRSYADVESRKETLRNEVYSVALENTELNKHEIMPILCGVIQHMQENGITPLINDPVKSKRTYPWVVCIANAIDNFSNHKNIRVFLAQAVDNCRNVFEPFAHILYKPILQLLSDECAGNKLNFFITDMIALLLSWSKKELHKPTSGDEICLSSSLLQFLMKNSWNANSKIYKYNLEILQTMIYFWKDRFVTPYKFLLDMIQLTERNDSKDNELGLILNGLILSNEIVPWIERTKITFIKSVFMNLNNDYAVVYQPAAHLYGMILFSLNKDQDLENFEFAKNELVNKLKAFANKHETKKEKYFNNILYGVHKNFPDILDSFKEIISYKIPSAIGAIKKMYLEMILTRLEAYETDEIYDIIISIGIRDLLKREEYQNLALHILNKSLPKLDCKEIYNLFSIIETCVESSKTDCRDITYEILIYISKNVAMNSEPNSPKNELKKKSDSLLLKGLLDTNGDIQKRIFHFWTQEIDLSQNIEERIYSLISNCSLDSQQQFLGFCTQLILEIAIQNPESKQQIFQFESSRENKLQEYDIDVSSRIRTMSMPPLFANSENKYFSENKYNFIRDTPNEYFFEPTKNPAELSQTQTQFTLSTQNSLPFTLRPCILNRRSQKLTGLESVEQVNNNFDEVNFLRKRFLRDKEKQDRENALQVIDQRSKKQAANQINNKDGKVTLYRRYRIGDYPDLLINSLAFLLPLQAIVKHDRYVGRQMFVSLFTSLIKNLGPESNQYITSIGNKIQNIFNESRTCDPMVFATFLEIALLKTEVFNIRPETVSMISKACNMQTIAAIYLETRINADFDESESGPLSKTGSCVTSCERHWLELSEVYYSLAEYDIVTAIFSDKVDADPRLAQAVNLKSSGYYIEAQDLLLKVIERRRLVEQNFSYNCFYECFEELGDWGMLTTAVQQQIDDFEELWTDEYNTNYFLPKIIRAELQLILRYQTCNKEFLNIFENWMNSDEIKSDYIKQTFCEELMMLQIVNSNFKQARVHCEDYLKKFLIEWEILSSHYEKLRQENILNMHKVSEVDSYALLLQENVNEKAIDVLVRKWDDCKINKSDSLRYWNCLLGYRTYLGALFISNLENLSSENTLTQRVQNSINKLGLQLLDAAIYQKNHGFANQLIKDLTKLDWKYNNLSFKFEIAQIKGKLMQIANSSDHNAFKVLADIWQQTHRILNDIAKIDEIKLQVDALQLKSKISEALFNKLSLVTDLNPQVINNFLQYMKGTFKTSVFKNKLLEESLNSLKKSAEIAKGVEILNCNNEKIIAKSFYCLAEFCFEYHQIEDFHLSFMLKEILISSVFYGMRYNCLKSQQLFPSLIELLSMENESLAETFIKNSEDVPEWMFLNWIPQILSRLNVKESSNVDKIVLRIAKKYPNALAYPFYTWLDENKSFIKNVPVFRKEISKIMELLKNLFLEKFIKGIKCLRFPHLLLLNWIIKMFGNFPNDQKAYEKLIDDILQIFEIDVAFHGSLYREILIYKNIFLDLKNKNVHTDQDEIRKELGDLKSKISKSFKKTDKFMQLESFCPWLAKFHWCGEETYIELPGQLNEIKKPNFEQNIKIVKFGERVEVFQSMRKPLRLKIYGSDAKQHDFIVKFGEDLKQDQRIQQVLSGMSEKLQSDRECRNHYSSIKTYEVIPFEQNGGMISFIHNTVTIDKLISDCFSRRQSNGKELLYKSMTDYMKFLKEPTKQNIDTKEFEMYGMAVKSYTRDQIIANFKNVESNINLYVIKHALVDMSVSPESFFKLRSNYAKSLASMNISHWLLGIGDRHLQNILISTKDGCLTGIDFGVILGGGTRNLIIPELMPFRLTPQFIKVLLPLGTSGIIFKCMSHALRVYRNSSKPLLASIEIFARNPSQDWITIQNQIKCDWKSMDTIKIVRRKLNGDNPMHILKTDLKDGVLAKHRLDFKEAYEKILQGTYQFNIRARLPECNLTVEEQIMCLIDLATDPAVLGCSYVGLNSWI